MAVRRETVVTCPSCDAAQVVLMSDRTPQRTYQCIHCTQRLRIGPRDHCVFCRYGSVPCPTAQQVELSSPALVDPRLVPRPLRPAQEAVVRESLEAIEQSQ